MGHDVPDAVAAHARSLLHDDGAQEARRSSRPVETRAERQAPTADARPRFRSWSGACCRSASPGFFLTEEAIRKALGDAVPRDWTDFVVSQSDRTRKEFLERLSFEIGQSLERSTSRRLLTELLEGRTLEVNAEIRLGPKGADEAATRLRVAASSRKKGPA